MSAGDKQFLSKIVKNMKKREDDPLSSLVDRYLVERVRPENRGRRLTEWTLDLKENVRPLGRLSPSSVGGCERQAVFKFNGVTGVKRVRPESELIFEDGHWRHHKWQAMFTEMEMIFGPDSFQCVSIEEKVRYESLRIAGALDAHIRIADRGEMVNWVVDVKGINSWGFRDIIASQEPKEAHVLQLLSYMRARKIRRGILLYDNKDDQRYKVFTIAFSAQRWAEAIEWCERVLSAVERERLPGIHPDCDSGTMLYERCPYRKLCFGENTNAKLERIAFKDFPGIDALWKEGIRLEEEG